MTKLPRVHCGKCGRPVAAGPVAGRISKGRLRRHDAPGIRRDAEGVLVSCAGSLELVDIQLPATQLALSLGELGLEDPAVELEEEAALF
ncbi:hypothetical protein ACFWAP_09025 [Streptomyces goshikiensis]|uniref:hypothetical protein n=1 Tax=Streptomyces goshikiensis TaxID=1942 RepID=UPI00364F36EB